MPVGARALGVGGRARRGCPRGERDGVSEAQGALWGQQGGPGALWALPAAAGCEDLGSASRPPTSWHRGTFYQGYLCTKCGVGAHKECLEVTPPCKISEYRRPRDAPRGPVLGLQ